jgi:pimeloyl-ACP methyl ester carboxylesterase
MNTKWSAMTAVVMAPAPARRDRERSARIAKTLLSCCAFWTWRRRWWSATPTAPVWCYYSARITQNSPAAWCFTNHPCSCCSTPTRQPGTWLNWPANTFRQAASLISQGAIEQGVRYFVDYAAFGLGTWDTLFTPEIRQTCIRHADTWLDQSRDPHRLSVRPELLLGYPHRIVVSHGDSGLPAYALIAEILAAAISAAHRNIIKGAGHGPHLTHPQQFADLIRRSARQVALQSARS